MALVPIYDETLASTEASFEVELPAGFAHVLMVISARGTDGASNQNLRARFNADSGNNYSWALGYANSGGAGGAASTGVSSARLGVIPAAGSTAGWFGVCSAMLVDYLGSQMKVARADAGMRYSGGIESYGTMSQWEDSDAITDVSIFPEAGSLAAGSRITVYGLTAVVPADQKISELTELTALVGTEEFVVADSGTSKKVTAATMLAGATGFSPADIVPSSPDAFDDEFNDSASLGDWTAYGASPTTEDIDTTVPGRLYMYRSTTSSKQAGRYKAATIPGSYKACLGAPTVRTNYHRGLNIVILPTGAISDSSPVVGVGYAYGDGVLGMFAERMSDLSSYAATIGNYNWGQARPTKTYWYLIFNSTTSVDLYWSTDGIAWLPVAIAYNPGWAMDKLGWGMRADSDSSALEGSIDWIRRVA